MPAPVFGQVAAPLTTFEKLPEAPGLTLIFVADCSSTGFENTLLHPKQFENARRHPTLVGPL